ncbi:hypothetical protein IWQ55_006593 [Labrenzia sp. EL_208]|nr:hypothetical protein [Labrenzia sp. EL_132]MBG6209759.1 hypothetical protein [Labrenzia sp. EL_126]MBG6233351.1 hypothetical protein [Labrenzia sp. EL_208]
MKKVTGYLFLDVIVSVFRTTANQLRCGVEATDPEYRGMLLIFNHEQLAPLSLQERHGWDEQG